MNEDEWLLALDELETKYKNLSNEHFMAEAFIKRVDEKIVALKLEKEALKKGLQFSREKAKVVELKTFAAQKERYDKVVAELTAIESDQRQNKQQQVEADKLVKSICERIEKFKQTKASTGKVIHHDFGRNKRVIDEG